jgi:hypothetical protein
MRRFRLTPSALARRSTDFSNAGGMWTVVGTNIKANISRPLEALKVRPIDVGAGGSKYRCIGPAIRQKESGARRFLIFEAPDRLLFLDRRGTSTLRSAAS